MSMPGPLRNSSVLRSAAKGRIACGLVQLLGLLLDA